MDYIELEWGGAEEQVKEMNAGNPDAKNWLEEAMMVLEQVVCICNLSAVVVLCIQ